MMKDSKVAEASAKYLNEKDLATSSGFKQTEIGVFPEDWQIRKLKEISPSQSVGLVINPSSYYAENGTVPMLVGSHIYENVIFWEKANRISSESNSRLPASRLKAGDLVTVRVGEPGITAVVPPELDGCNCASMMIVRQSPQFNSNWLCFLMNSRIGRSQIESVQYGTAQKQFNIVDAIDFVFPYPIREEQTAIANALSDVDALINSLEKLIAKKQAIKTATMQQLLTGKTRLPQFATHPDGTPKGYKQSELGEIPEDWEVKCVIDIAEYQKAQFDDGDWVEAEHITDKGIRLIQTGNIGVGEYLEKDSKKYIYEESFTKLKCKELKIGDLLICRLAEPAGRACILPDIAEEKIITSVDVTIFRPKPEIADRQYLVQYFSSEQWFKSVLEQVGGTTHKRISRGALGRLVIPYPPIEEQHAVSKILADMSEDIAKIQQRVHKTRQLKQGMMQELLTGKTRLVKPAGSAA